MRFLFYFLGQTREVYTVDISYNGAFIQTDVFPPLGAFIILEHYHLKKRNVTLGLVGKIRRIQTPFQSSPAVRGVGVEWVRCYCNQGFLPLKQFLERDLGYQPFDWDTHLLYEEYDRKIVYDFATSTLSPTQNELEAIFGQGRRKARRVESAPTAPGARTDAAETESEAGDEGWRRSTRPVVVVDPALTATANMRPGFAEDATVPPAVRSDEATVRFERADTVPPTAVIGAEARDADDVPEVPAVAEEAPGAFAPTGPDEPPTPAADALTDDLYRVEVKVVFGVGNRMFYGVVRGVNERELFVETTSPQALKANARIQVRMPLNAKSYRYMVVIFGRVASVDERADGTRSFRLRIESLDEFQNPGGFRFFLQTLAR
jgi:hypothetical protein